MEEKILTLTLKKKWFDMIASGDKRQEYRELKPYWMNRFLLYVGNVKDVNFWKWDEMLNPESAKEQILDHPNIDFQKYTHIVFKNGYAKDAPTIKVEFNGFMVGDAIPKWSDNWQGSVFILKLGNIK